MKAIAVRRDLNALSRRFAPRSRRLTVTAMERYIRWTREDGTQPFDPWLRTHRRVGARIVKNCAALDVIPGTVAQWEDWTGMKFP